MGRYPSVGQGPRSDQTCSNPADGINMISDPNFGFIADEDQRNNRFHDMYRGL